MVGDLFDARAKERLRQSGSGNVTGPSDARDEAGRAFGVSGSLVDRVRRESICWLVRRVVIGVKKHPFFQVDPGRVCGRGSFV